MMQKLDEAKSNDMKRLLGDVDDDSLEEELKTCRHFFVDSNMENGRHRVFKIAMDSLNQHLLIKKMNLVFDSLNCVANLKIVFGFVLKAWRMAVVATFIHTKMTH